MSKEVTLDDLVKSSNNAKPAVRAEQVNQNVSDTPNKSNVAPANNIKSAKPISTSDLGKNLQAQNPDAKKKIVDEDAPLVANAFEAMDKTLAEKKRKIEEAMPVIMENAREMAMEKEMESIKDEDEISTSDILADDDFSDLDDLEETTKKEDDGVYVAPKLDLDVAKEEKN